MSIRGYRLIGSAIVVAGGGITFSLGLLARAHDRLYGDGGETVGLMILVPGAALFAADWLVSWLEDRRRNPE